MKEPEWVLIDTVLFIHARQINEHAGDAGIRDKGLLESALEKPKNLYSYDKKASLFDLAAAYGFALSKNHPFIDGNKRVALVVMELFLELNGYSLEASDEEVYEVSILLASGKLTQKELSAWIGSQSESL